ncbi:MAG: acyl carrier protein [Hyphomicrobiales bacterium]|nr:MAG: acyl carrier protein [Hyphomicrobiales bacterium]
MPTPIDACALVARALEIQGSVDLGDTVSTLPAWDSLGHLRLMLELEAVTGRPLTADEIATLSSVRAVERILAGA